ncbi:MAG: hypothetical protein JWQ27_829 [Ferruginibacter sp.]|nr:hypothetical protein [Ferruginibacter sp.]
MAPGFFYAISSRQQVVLASSGRQDHHVRFTVAVIPAHLNSVLDSTVEKFTLIIVMILYQAENRLLIHCLLCTILLVTGRSIISCTNASRSPARETIAAINLKKGNIVYCGPPGKQYGDVNFETSCSGVVTADFNLGMALLHSFEYDEAEKAFAKVIDAEPRCAMAYWGVAMSNYHQVWPSPPSDIELEKGKRSIDLALTLKGNSEKETAYLQAMDVFYNDYQTKNHRSRSVAFTNAMEALYKKYPADKEAAIFYALALDGSADPADKTFSNQKKAGTILNALYPGEPDHPGIVHYIIHSYDSPELAALALPAARKYAAIAPSSAHAQHMPSHIFTRLGLWDEAIQSNVLSTASAKCYAETAGIKGHWDEELHGLDYLEYAYLQKGDSVAAKKLLDYLYSIREVYPQNFKVAYAFAAIPARYYLENRQWKAAAELKTYPENFPWQKFPWQRALTHFARLLGNAQLGNNGLARSELAKLHGIHDTLLAMKDTYKATQVMIQLQTGEAWILFKEGRRAEGLALMTSAATLEDNTEKSPVTPGELLPAKELLADMLLVAGKNNAATLAYQQDLQKHPNRRNGLAGLKSASHKE